MGKFRTYDFSCPNCGEREEAVLFDLDSEDPDEYNCIHCGAKSQRMIGAPTVLTVAIPDGLRRNDEKFQNAKRIADLQVEAAEAAGTPDRKEIEKEIKERCKPITKGGG